MARYVVHLTTWANTSIEVEADDPEQAKELAEESGQFPTLCHQCSGYGRGQSLDIGDEWDAKEVTLLDGADDDG